MRADLHIHTRYSDGSDTVNEVIDKARALRLDMIALTDHDTFEHTKNIPHTEDIKIVHGIEISAEDPTNRLKAHILGYNVKDKETVEEFCKETLMRRHKNSLELIDVLKTYDYSFDMEKIDRAQGKYLYKIHIINYLIDTGQVSDSANNVYRALFGEGKICQGDIRYVPAVEAVRIIKDCGGIPVLAHSGQQQNFYMVDDLVKSGLEGMELYHPSNSTKDMEKIIELSKKFGLILTGGSDYHGKNGRKNQILGKYLSPYTNF